MNKKLKTYKILEKIAHMDVESEQKILKDLKNIKEEMETHIKDLRTRISKERELIAKDSIWGGRFQDFQKATELEIDKLNLKIQQIDFRIESEKEILLDFFATEKKFGHMVTQKEMKIQKEEERKEMIAMEDLILMRSKNNTTSIPRPH